MLIDILGQEVKTGDRVAVGMAAGRSSVLRVGTVLYVREKEVMDYYGNPTNPPYFKYSVRVKWDYSSNKQERETRWRVEESTILYESGWSYSKLIVLPPGFVEKFEAELASGD